MGLAERSRAVLHTKLTEVVGDEEAVGDMLSEFPAHDLERPATKEFVRAEVAELRTELAGLRTDNAERETRLMEFIHVEVTSSMRWVLGVFLTAQSVVIGLVVAFT
ncbi:MAG TPA: hypothetical protein VGO60_00990 [Iamia sp.]|jgi:hypothetical protein|nr:hypothetical protein [Iamia sp.]